MNLQRVFAALLAFVLFSGIVGCKSWAPNGPRYAGTKSASNMNMANSMWEVSGDGAPQAPPSER